MAVTPPSKELTVCWCCNLMLVRLSLNLKSYKTKKNDTDATINLQRF
jgi:hypothetical protein